MNISNRWILKHMIMASLIASYSKDDSTKCGAVIVRPNNSIASTGYNGFPRGVDDSIKERFERPTKYLYTEHSERNAIYNCIESMNGYSMFVYTFPNKLTICSDCARAIIQSGISEVYLQSSDTADHWQESCMAADEMFKEVGVNINFVDISDLTILTTEMTNILKST